MTQDILAKRDGAILELRLNRPDKKNALTSAMYEMLNGQLREAADDGDIRVVTLTGAGDSFSAGNDLNDFLLATQGSRDSLPAIAFLELISRFPKPIVAGVQGNAVGVGTTLLLHCDFVLAAPDARFMLPFVDLGLVPEGGSSMLLPQLVGHRRAARHLMLAEPFDAAEALDYGLVSSIIAGDMGQAVRDVANQLVAKPQVALTLTKALLRGDPHILADHMKQEFDLFLTRLGASEAQEAIQKIMGTAAGPSRA